MYLCRSEAFGLIIADAMARGLHMVATNWSRNVDFLTEENDIPIGYRMVPAEDPQETYHHPEMRWAEANIEEVAVVLRRLRNDRALAHGAPRLTSEGSASVSDCEGSGS